jgi:soluble cytochrome b562
MKRIFMLLAAAFLVFLPPALLSAQMCTPGQCMVEPGFRKNMGTISAMMGDMHQMLQSGKLTPAQQKHILEMMNQMSGIMKNMGSLEAPQKEAQIQQQLQQMQKGLQDMKAQLSK